MQNTWSPRTKGRVYNLVQKVKLDKNIQYTSPSSKLTEIAEQKDHSLNSKEQEVQSKQKEDYMSMSTEEILMAIELVLNS